VTVTFIVAIRDYIGRTVYITSGCNNAALLSANECLVITSH